MADLARAADGRRPPVRVHPRARGCRWSRRPRRLGAIHCYLEGDPGADRAPRSACTRPARPTAPCTCSSPYDPGVFYGLLDKAGLKVVCLPQLYADLVHYERRGPEQAEHLRREAMGY